MKHIKYCSSTPLCGILVLYPMLTGSWKVGGAIIVIHVETEGKDFFFLQYT